MHAIHLKYKQEHNDPVGLALTSGCCSGNPGTVELDETLFCRRKYNRGRYYARQQWVFGGTCRESGESFVVPVENCLSASFPHHTTARAAWDYHRYGRAASLQVPASKSFQAVDSEPLAQLR
ncbi:hypothetical protein M514_09474 [Trichuris suis]|uniref:ISXO2-like transposase domain-containing protein n=1 Tax=Trichuris suis TaxID=68888 RepID=A0A085LXE6_9BILA|nr:hypothetical protein M513_09474 [Trichuris suis]KFD66293.1 hypothetical protein M514_09474 [Trichuris suis]